jgi:uncharacterized protein YoxC
VRCIYSIHVRLQRTVNPYTHGRSLIQQYIFSDVGNGFRAVVKEIIQIKEGMEGVQDQIAGVKLETEGTRQEVIGLRQDLQKLGATLEKLVHECMNV